MRVITIIQAKGGSGKTTLAMALTSGALSEGKKVHLMDGDRNPQLMEWPTRYKEADWELVEKPNWPKNVSLSVVPDSVGSLYDELNELDAKGVDLVVIDTRPGTHQDTEDLVFAADTVLIPARPNQMEYMLVQDAYVWVNKLRNTISPDDDFPDVRLVVSDAPKAVIDAAMNKGTDKLSKRDYDVLVKLVEMPHFTTIIPNSKVWSHVTHYGPLGIAVGAFEKTTGARLMARPLKAQLEIAKSLINEILNAGEPN